MRSLPILLQLAGCLHISDDEHAARLDPDRDGVPWPDDACEGDDASGDSDRDGICDGGDRCAGDDAAGDGDEDGSCADLDCDDDDPARSPLSAEVPGDDTDEDCDGTVACWVDADRDGFGVDTVVDDDGDGRCLTSSGEADDADDCDDAEPLLHPPRCENAEPRPSLILSAAAVELGGTVVADAGSSSDSDGDPLRFRFDLDGDGGFEIDAGEVASAEVPAEAPGLRRVVVEVGDGLATAIAEAWVFVEDGQVLPVTTTRDDDDHPDPYVGGLSLREALGLCDALPGRQTVILAPGTYRTGPAMPPLTDPEGAVLAGQPGVILDGASGGQGNGLTLAGGPNLVIGLTLQGYAEAVRVEAGDGARIVGVTFLRDETAATLGAAGATFGPGNVARDGTGPQVVVAGASVVTGNALSAGNGDGIVVTGAGDAARIEANVIAGFLGSGLRLDPQAGGADDVTATDNTFVANGEAGVTIGERADRTTLVNNLFADHAVGVAAVTAPGRLEHNGWHANAVDCQGCALGPTDLRADPHFLDPAALDLRLAADSPCLDAGVETGVDKNGAAPGDHSGAAPDLGALERYR